VATVEQLDWLNASREARQLLYRHTKRLIDGSSLTWRRLFREALDLSSEPGTGYEDNFRAGRIARSRAARLYGWLRSNHPDVADALDRELTGADPWDEFLSRHAQSSGIEIVLLNENAASLVALARTDVDPMPRIRLGHPFCFRLINGEAGVAIALQSVGTDWHVLPLSEPCAAAPVQAGDCWLPAAADGTAEPLKEDHDIGRHRFAIFIGDPEEIAPIADGLPIDRALRTSDTAAIVQAFDHATNPWRLLRLDAHFVS